MSTAESADPTRAKLRMDTALPICTKSTTLKAEPKRLKDRTLKEEPSSTCWITDRVYNDPNRP
jgi:hypothetical protein